MSEAAWLETRTIHRMLELDPKQEGLARKQGSRLKGDLLVMDENSMIDLQPGHPPLRAVPDG